MTTVHRAWCVANLAEYEDEDGDMVDNENYINFEFDKGMENLIESGWWTRCIKRNAADVIAQLDIEGVREDPDYAREIELERVS